MAAVAVCIALTGAAAVMCVLRAQRNDPPPLADASAWQWVSAPPGLNVYMHQLSGQHPTKQVRAWVAFRFFSSPVTVNADVIELWEFDCSQYLSRRVAGPFRGSSSSEFTPGRATPAAPWRRAAPATMPSAILTRICATAG